MQGEATDGNDDEAWERLSAACFQGFRANCARKVQDNRPWRIHTSIKEDLGTMMVKKNPYDHDCLRTRRKKEGQEVAQISLCVVSKQLYP
ncbi:uncharacterized protein C2845_PM16G13280 [Panicum miliaceum]|uniref:Uncharacterized protein n=1 Tax=Panicum miliaceum TaxID=4540 RepID=A0A3L6PZ44_PANMI|nr:uncharacterized protein C2845_PM16G13280 [Panicum miliaceum]